jgi:multisubunit Na+/H+ antiporter MnhE subunit
VDAAWPNAGRGWLKLSVEVVVWWGLAFGIWLMSLSATSGQEFLVAALASLPCGLAAAAARRAIEQSWAVTPSALKPLLLVPVAIFTDAAQVLAAPIANRARGGRFETIPTNAAGDTAQARGRRALATAWVSITPGTFVLDVDPDSGAMLVHSLAFRGPRVANFVARDSS